jgi:hypothetical protein
MTPPAAAHHGRNVSTLVRSKDGNDALASRTLGELKGFVRWLHANNVKGVISEVGWPTSSRGSEWDALAERWYKLADAAGLSVMAWTTGLADYHGADWVIYDSDEASPDATLDRANDQAAVVERHPSTSRYWRGVSVPGLEHGYWNGFSSADPGTYGQDYFCPSKGSFSFLSSRHIDTVRLGFRWERIQPHLYRALDSTELHRLDACIQRAHQAGLRVVLDLHNYGHYDFPGPVEAGLGSNRLPISVFADVWSRLAQHFRGNPAVIALGIMNEPYGLNDSVFTPSRTLFGWNGGVDGWVGADIASTRNVVRTGSGALQITLDHSPHWLHRDGILTLPAGASLAVWVFVPPTVAMAVPPTIELQAFDKNWALETTGAVSIPYGRWTRVVLTPRHDVLKALGIYISASAADSVIVDNLQVGSGLSGAPLWEQASQAAVSAIRAAGSSQEVDVALYDWSGIQSVWANHPRAWIRDPANNIRYDGHHYWDCGHSGADGYDRETYETELTAILAGHCS